jgi:hypothetical protein
LWFEQAIFTSLPRQNRGGYHLVSRSKGLSVQEAQAITRWSPSHGSLLHDQNNRVSVNFFGLPGGRFALSRSCEGPPEYSGRGGRQLYTHILVFDAKCLEAVAGQPFVIYQNALALGHLFYQFNPTELLEPVEIPGFHCAREPKDWLERANDLGLPDLEPLRTRLLTGRAVRFSFAGDRAALAECLIGSLGPSVVPKVSFATSLHPSSDRPFILSLVDSRKSTV